MEADRSHNVDAALMRIMKKGRTLAHNALLAQVADVLKFRVSPAFIKQRIGTLFTKECLERDEEDPGLDRYQA